MRINKLLTGIVVIAVVAGAGTRWWKSRQGAKSFEERKVIQPVMGSIKKLISCTGTILPKNRLEVKPPVNGRIESILVKEGEQVKTGQTVAWMSSTERAALLDAARGEGEEKLKYWEETYKPIPLLAPIDGEVIVATMQPGQAVTAADAVVVLSDHLIVRAQVDEIDIGKIAEGMKVFVTLDAYPDEKINGAVEHIYYESQTVSNVTIYPVDILTAEVPSFFRSGMNASVDFLILEKQDILIIPVEAVSKNGGRYVFVEKPGSKDPEKRPVTLGITDDKNIEVISGVTGDDRLIVTSKKFVLPKSSSGTNPFLPARRR